MLVVDAFAPTARGFLFHNISPVDDRDPSHHALLPQLDWNHSVTEQLSPSVQYRLLFDHVVSSC